MKTKTAAQLSQEMADIRRQLEAIEYRKMRAANKKFIGKCFKYHNSYGSGDKWWLYVRVLGYSSGSFYLRTVQFQTDCQGRCEIRENVNVNLENYQPISSSEYDAARAKLFAAVENIIGAA